MCAKILTQIETQDMANFLLGSFGTLHTSKLITFTITDPSISPIHLFPSPPGYIPPCLLADAQKGQPLTNTSPSPSGGSLFGYRPQLPTPECGAFSATKQLLLTCGYRWLWHGEGRHATNQTAQRAQIGTGGYMPYGFWEDLKPDGPKIFGVDQPSPF